MKKTLKQTLLISGALVGVGVLANAQPGSRGFDRVRPVDEAQLQATLGIDAGQAESLRKLHSEQRKARVRNRADMEIARLELEELLAAETIDEKAVSAKVQVIADLQARALRERTDARIAVRKILTVEQERKLRQVQRSRHGGRDGDRPARRSRGERTPPVGGKDDDPGLPTEGEPR